MQQSLRLYLALFLLIKLLCLPKTIKSNENDSLLDIINTSTNKSEVLSAKIQLSKLLSWTDTHSARRLQQSIQQEMEHETPKMRAEFYNASAIRLWFDRQYDSAIAILKQTIALENEITDELLVEAINNVGTLYNIIGKSDSSSRYLHRALDIDLRRNELNGLAKTYYDLGILYKQKDHHELAVHYLHEATKIQEKLNIPERLIRTLDVTATLYVHLKDTTNAHLLYKKALMLAESLNNPEVNAHLYSNYAFFLLNQALKPQEALSFALKSIELYEGLGEHKSGWAAYANLGSAYIALGDTTKGLFYYRKAIKETDNIGINGKADLLSVYATVLLDFNMVDSAIFYNEQAAALINQLESFRLKSRLYQNWARIDSARADFQAAFSNLKIHQQFEDSALNIEHLSRIEELRIIHQLENKEKENQGLREQNQMKERIIINQRVTLFFGIGFIVLILIIVFLQRRSRALIIKQKNEIETKNAELTLLNKTKDKFISIIAHDLRSPFNALLGSLDYIVNSGLKMNQDEQQKLLRSIYESSINTYNLLVNLLDWTIAQKNGFKNHPQWVDLNVATEQVFRFLKSRAEEKQHELINQVEADLQVFADSNILNNILINLVNNSIKFTPNGGKIKVSAICSAQNIGVCVEDNGIGIPQDKIGGLFNIGSEFYRKGTAHELGTGLGLILVKEFVELCNASIHVESEEGKGSTFCVLFPASAKTET